MSEKRVPSSIKHKPDHLRGKKIKKDNNNTTLGWSQYEYDFMGDESHGSEYIVLGQRRNIL